VHRTVKSSLLEHFPLRQIRRQRNVNFRGKTDNASRRILRHFLLHRNRHAAKAEFLFLGAYRHRCRHAGAEGSGDKIGGRERFAFSPIVGWRVGLEARLRWPVCRLAMQVAGVFDGNIDHALLCGAIRCLSSRAKRSGVEDSEEILL
jgi:hypothetical protein